MEFRKVVICTKCQQPIVSGAGFGYVCFKIPGREDYHFFHRRSTTSSTAGFAAGTAGKLT